MFKINCKLYINTPWSTIWVPNSEGCPRFFGISGVLLFHQLTFMLRVM